MAGKGEKAKIPLKSCGLGEGCSVVHGVGCEGAGREPRMGLCVRDVPSAVGTRVSGPASPHRSRRSAPGRFSWLVKWVKQKPKEHPSSTTVSQLHQS